MIDPHKMIFTNILLSSLLLIAILVFKYLKKQKINLFFVIIGFSIVASISVFRPGAYESGDFNIHIYRSMEFFQNLSQGNFMPSWAGNLNAGYGYPLFLFNYTFPYYLISGIHLLGFSFIASLKIFLFLNMVLSAVFMYLFSKEKFKNEFAAFAASSFYIFFPYHLVSLHFKVTIGEVLSFTLIPLLFLFIQKFITKKGISFIYLSSIVLSLMVLSHIFVAIFIIPLMLIYLFSNSKNYKFILKSFTLIVIPAVFISSYQWLAPIIYRPYLFTTLFPTDVSRVFSPSIFELLYSPWRLGLLFQGPQGEISYLLGYAQIFIVLTAIFLLYKKKFKKADKKPIIIWIISLITLILLIIPQSRLLWENLPLINAAGPHRLLLIVGFVIAILSGFIYKQINSKKILLLLLAICIFSTILNWGQRRVISSIDDNVLRTNLPQSTSQGEAHFYAFTKWSNPRQPWFTKVENVKIQTLYGKADFKEAYRNQTLHMYKSEVFEDSQIKENTLFFPGWKLYANGKEVSIYPDKNGVISFNLSSGKYTIILVYKDIESFRLIKLVGVFSLIIVLGALTWKRLKD